jgi:hypothetical protein
METNGTLNEIRIAEEIVRVLPEGSWARVCSDDREAVRYAVRSHAMKLRSVVLSRASLRKLAADPARDVKLEYLQRDLLRSALRRAEFRYPRLSTLRARKQTPAFSQISFASAL